MFQPFLHQPFLRWMQWFRCLVWHFTVCFDIFRSSGSRSPSTVSLLGGEVGCFWQSMDDGICRWLHWSFGFSWNLENRICYAFFESFGTWTPYFLIHLELGKPYLLCNKTSNQQWPVTPLQMAPNGMVRHWHIGRHVVWVSRACHPVPHCDQLHQPMEVADYPCWKVCLHFWQPDWSVIDWWSIFFVLWLGAPCRRLPWINTWSDLATSISSCSSVLHVVCPW